MCECIDKSHNVSVLLYHNVCSAKYCRVVFSEAVDKILKEIYLEISKRYEVEFVVIVMDKDHVHFLMQSVPSLIQTQIIRTLKRITVKETFGLHRKVRPKLWGGEFWANGYYVNTQGRHGDENTIHSSMLNLK